MARNKATSEAERQQGSGYLPVDSDVDNDVDVQGQVSGRESRPIHLQPRFVLLVVAGGCLGALARYGLSLALPTPAGWPLPTLLINLLGAFALGALLEGLSRRGPDTGRLRLVRLLAGTGFMGAFTTFSTLAVDAVHLLETGAFASALVYLTVSLLGGIGAALAGIWIAARHHRARTTSKNDIVAVHATGEK